MNSTEVADAPAKTRAIAKHGYVDASGTAVDQIEKATGNSYVDLATGKQILNVFDIKGDDKELARILMFACFGWRTLATNEASAWRQAAERGDEDLEPDQAAAIESRMEQIASGTWRERGEGSPRGPKYDPVVMANALVAVLGDKAAGDAAHYHERYTTDKSYAAKVRSNTSVMAKYYELSKTAAPATADSLA